MSLPLIYFKSLMFIDVNLLINIPIQKSFLNIHLMNVRSHSSSQRNKWSYYYIYSCRSKGFFVINPFFMWETTCYKPYFLFINAPICNVLYLENTFLSDYRFVTWPWDNFPDIILLDWLVFFFHCIPPHLMFSNIFIGGRFCFNKLCRVYNIP